MDPILVILNKVIEGQLPTINSDVRDGILSKGLDPLGHVTGGSAGIGSINLGIGTLSANASYSVGNLRGLSTLGVDHLAFTSATPNPDNPEEVSGTVALSAHLGSNLTASVGGDVSAHAIFKTFRVGISGSVTASGVTASAGGTFQATVIGTECTLTQVHLTGLSLDYSNVGISIDGLGIFNALLSPLENVILDAVKPAIRNGLGSALQPVLDSEINKILPIGGKLT